MPSLLLDDFSGGFNLRDSPNQLLPNESPGCINWTLDERGGLSLRKGCEAVVALPGVTNKKADVFYSEALDLWLCARETSGAPNTYRLHSRPGDLTTGSWTDRGKISDNASVATVRTVFVDWPGTTNYAMVATSIGDATDGGIYTFDGTTLTKRSGIFPKCIALWQNRIWASGFPDATNRFRVVRSDIGDPIAYTAFTDLRDKDAAGVTAMGTVSGALIIFKKQSAYRVNDSATGAYSMIDSAVGCVNARAIVALRGRLYVWGADGMYECDGVGALRNVGDKIRPVYLSPDTDDASIVAGIFEDKVIFAGSMSGAGELEPFPFLEFSPSRGWIVQHKLAGGSGNPVSSMSTQDGVLYGAMYGSTVDDLYSMFTDTPGEDPIDTYNGDWDTPWLLPNSGMLARLQRVRVQGLLAQGSSNTAAVALLKDWVPGAVGFDITTALRQSASAELQKAADIQSLGHAVAFQVVLGAGGAAGSAVIRSLQLIDTSLQYPSPGYPGRPGSRGGSGGRGRPPPSPGPTPLPGPR